MAAKPPQRGDVVCISWVDIHEDPVGNPEAAKLARRKSVGLFWEEREDDGVPVIVTTTTKDTDGHVQSGYCVYPVGCVTLIRVLRRRPLELE